MRKKKYVLRPLELWDPGAAQQWLEDEAARGWFLTDCGTRLAKLERRKPAACRVRIQPCKPEPEERWKERFAAYEAMGWVFASSLTPDYEVFYCDDPSAPELDTDPVAWGWAWEKPLRRSWRMAWAALVLVALTVLPVALSGKPALECLLALRLYQMFWMPIMFCLAVMSVRRLWHLRRIRRQMAAGVAPSAGNWRRDRRWQQAFTLLFLLFWLLMLSGNIADAVWQSEPDTAGLPYTSPVSLVEGTNKEYWEFEGDNYVYRSTPLAPVRSGSQYRGKNGECVRNAADRLRFTFLAKALYRERAADFRRDRPDAAETAVEYGIFDEAVLLAEGDEQLFLARKGTIVYALWVDFPVDLSGSIEHTAVLLADTEGEGRT